MIGSARLLLAFIMHLAGVIQGEGGVELELLGPPLATVGVNRAAIGKEFGPWHGYAEPSARAVEMAWEAYRVGSTLDGDLFSLSKRDMATLGFDTDAPWWTEMCSDDGRWCMYTGRKWK